MHGNFTTNVTTVILTPELTLSSTQYSHIIFGFAEALLLAEYRDFQLWGPYLQEEGGGKERAVEPFGHDALVVPTKVLGWHKEGAVQVQWKMEWLL